MGLEEVRKKLIDCTQCELRQGATQPVMGIGNVGAKYFLIGEAPGKSEDRVGVPFVGHAGQKLNELMELAGIDQNDCYLTNCVKCRPPKNRDPRKKEIRACAQWLQEELLAVQPETIITLGRIPLSLFCPYGIKQTHGTMFEWEIKDERAKTEPETS